MGDPSMTKRWIRKAAGMFLPILGMGVAFSGVLYLEGEVATLLAVLAGILLVEAGVWNIANPFLPSSRSYNELREETDDFIGLVRRLNSAAEEGRRTQATAAWARYEETLREMHSAVDRMGELAGKREGDPATRPPVG